MKHLLIVLCILAMFSCMKEVKPVKIIEQEETIDTLYAWSQVWIGPKKWVDSMYGEFLAKEGKYFMTRHERMRRLAKDVIK